MRCPSFPSSTTPHKQDGPWAWVVLMSAFLTTLLSGGLGISFGVFLPVFMEEFNESRDKAALIGSLNFAVFLCLIVVSSQLCDRHGCQVICAIGHVLSAAGFVLSSLQHNIIPLYFTHSLLSGFGSSCIQGSGFLVVGHYFKKRRSFAVGVVSSAVGVGAICLAPMIQYLLDTMDWRNIFRLLAGIYVAMSFLTLSYSSNVEKTESADNEGEAETKNKSFLKSVFDLSVWRIPMFTVAVVSNMIACFGHSTLKIHIVKYATEMGISADDASTLFVAFGSSSVLARILAGRLCDVSFIKPSYVNQAAEILSGIVTIALTQASSYVHVLVLVLFYGVADGAFRTTTNLLFLNSVGPARMASAFGQGSLAISIFAATGPVVSGAIADKYNSYVPAFYMAGAITISSSFIYLVLCCMKPTTESEALPAPDIESDSQPKDRSQSISSQEQRESKNNSDSIGNGKSGAQLNSHGHINVAFEEQDTKL